MHGNFGGINSFIPLGYAPGTIDINNMLYQPLEKRPKMDGFSPNLVDVSVAFEHPT